MTIEDETSVANIIIWEKVFEKFRRTVLGSGMIGIKGRVQREGEVIHIVAHHLTDLSAELASIGARELLFPLSQDLGDGLQHGSSESDPHDLPMPANLGDDHGRPDEIKVKTRDFR